ncbi:MAG: hypothetical protein NC235_14800 [Clostridiales bacterium]|nr:hypothetical protein [Clostridiales bacterium]
MSKEAGFNRSTWFRNFTNKSQVLN